MSRSDNDPLFGPPPEKRTELARAPLTGVLTQLRFGEIFSMQKREFIAPFQELIRQSYPLTDQQAAVSIQVGEGNAPTLKQTVSWKFSDAAKVWTISLAPDFLSLETKQYSTRVEFRDRLREVLEAMAVSIRPPLVTRTGVRYVNRLLEPEIGMLRELFRAEIGSFSSSALREHIQHSLTEALCETQEGKLLVRWGLMPGGASPDLGLLPPINAKSWVFDLDSFCEHQPVPAQFDPVALSDLVYDLATRVNTFFYWAALPKLIDVFGGKR